MKSRAGFRLFSGGRSWCVDGTAGREMLAGGANPRYVPAGALARRAGSKKGMRVMRKNALCGLAGVLASCVMLALGFASGRQAGSGAWSSSSR